MVADPEKARMVDKFELLQVRTYVAHSKYHWHYR